MKGVGKYEVSRWNYVEGMRLIEGIGVRGNVRYK